MRSHRWPNGSRTTAIRPTGLSSGARSRIAPPSTRRATTAVDVVDGQVQRHRGAVPLDGGLDLDLRVLVGHHPAGAVDAQLDVADPPVGHHDRVVGDLGAEPLDVPLRSRRGRPGTARYGVSSLIPSP